LNINDTKEELKPVSRIDAGMGFDPVVRPRAYFALFASRRRTLAYNRGQVILGVLSGIWLMTSTMGVPPVEDCR
jgi:hypothetical protein